jgi:hypothetical protein
MLKLFVDPLKSLPKLIRVRFSALGIGQDLPGFFFLRVEGQDVGLEAADLLRNPALGVLAAKKDMEQWINRSQLGEEK